MAGVMVGTNGGCKWWVQMAGEVKGSRRRTGSHGNAVMQLCNDYLSKCYY